MTAQPPHWTMSDPDYVPPGLTGPIPRLGVLRRYRWRRGPFGDARTWMVISACAVAGAVAGVAVDLVADPTWPAGPILAAGATLPMFAIATRAALKHRRAYNIRRAESIRRSNADYEQRLRILTDDPGPGR